MVGSKAHPSKNNSSMKDYFRSLLNNKEIMDIFEITKDDIENRNFNATPGEHCVDCSFNLMCSEGLARSKSKI